MAEDAFEPKIVGFLCNWCSYRAADGAGTARIKHAANVRIIRLMCSGRVDLTFVLKALSLGADGVLIAGCHLGECHYIQQNYKTIRRFTMLRHTLRTLGIDDRRVQLVWASAGEAAHLAKAINQMVEDVRQLGPLHWPKNWAEDSAHLEAAGEHRPRARRGKGGVRMKDKGKLAIYWAASCGGCEISILALNEKILDVAAAFDIVFCPCIMDTKVRHVEAMPDQGIDVCLFNGGIRTSEQEYMARLLRQKSKVLVAFGSCADEGCIPGLANLTTRQEIFQTCFLDGPSTENPAGTVPQVETRINGFRLTLPVFYDTVRTLGQTVLVDYYLPGCPPRRRASGTLSWRSWKGNCRRPARSLAPRRRCATSARARAKRRRSRSSNERGRSFPRKAGACSSRDWFAAARPRGPVVGRCARRSILPASAVTGLMPAWRILAAA